MFFEVVEAGIIAAHDPVEIFADGTKVAFDRLELFVKNSI